LPSSALDDVLAGSPGTVKHHHQWPTVCGNLSLLRNEYYGCPMPALERELDVVASSRKVERGLVLRRFTPADAGSEEKTETEEEPVSNHLEILLYNVNRFE
jgi:hypothetical protein